MAYRFATIIVILVGAYTFLIFHLYQLQLVKGGYYLAKAVSEASASADANANRGVIYFTDRNGGELPAAVNKQFPIIYAVPTAVKNPKAAAAELAPVLGMSSSALTALLSKQNDSYELLQKRADPKTAQDVDDLKIPGIYTDFEFDRYYPLGTIASQLVGFVGPNATGSGESGHYGLEKLYNSYLAGVATSGPSAMVGSDLELTIDPNIQTEAEKVLADLIQKNDATGGSVIVEEPQTGKILAMGAEPDFDPNNYGTAPVADFMNTNVESRYEPGSIMKVITMAAGIDAGKITPNTTYDDKGYLNVNKARITNYDLTTHGPYGPGTTMTQVIEHSINTGAIYAENQTGNATFLEYLKKFGLGTKTGVDLPGEIVGDTNQLTLKSPQVNWDTAAYGQGVAVTPVELVSAIAAIANGGVMMRPYVNTALGPKVVGRAISTSTAKQVTQMMVDAVDLAKIANIDGYSLAGKTGSAFMPDLVHGGYLDRLTDSYIGFGPTANPRFIAFIRLNTLPVTSLAAESVVPAFRELSQYIINYYNIPPDRIAGRTSSNQ